MRYLRYCIFMSALMIATSLYAWRKVSGKGSLRGKQLAVLKEIARWREETAERRDIPRGWVLKDQTLVEVARQDVDRQQTPPPELGQRCEQEQQERLTVG